MDQRGGRPRRKRISAGTVPMVCRLKREIYPDFSLRHSYEQLSEKHAVKVSYNRLWVMLQEGGSRREEARARPVSPLARASADGRHAGASGCVDPTSGSPGCQCRT